MNFKNKISNVSQKIISSFWGELSHLSFDYLFNNGKIKSVTHEVYGKSDGVAVLLYNTNTKNVILTKQFRSPVYVATNNGESIELIGGAIDNNETPTKAAIRETEEEVGYKVDKLTKVSTVFLSPGIVKEKVYLFIGEYDESNKTENEGGVFNEDEEIEVLEINFNKALQMIKNEEIVDARTILLLQYVFINKIM
ncbi:MAG: NUDIX domain-containing protein [Flavobacteriaceae bacterium]|nr:NUDIX domain-containing protein [Flavobacteriaceae bacterium]